MSGIITAVVKATIGWLVDKGRDKAAEKLQSGDVTDQQFRGIIMREIDDMKSKLDGLSRKDLLASISFFSEGIELLYEVFDETRPRSEFCADTAQAASVEAVLLTEGMRNLELTEPATRKLASAKKRFERAREKATEAFSNEALSTSDRILAAQYRVMPTVLETIDNPADALAPCKVCIKHLNGLPTVQQIVQVQLRTTGIDAVKGLFKKEERRKAISGVYRVNRIAYDVIQTVSAKEPFPQWSMVNTGEGKFDILRDGRVTKALRKQGMENCSLLWILGQDGEEEHKIKRPIDIATNSSGQYIVADHDLTIKVFDNSGKFVKRLRLPPLFDDVRGCRTIINVPRPVERLVGLTTDINDNIYVLVEEKFCKGSNWIIKFNETADQHHTFPLRNLGSEYRRQRLSVSDSGKIVVLRVVELHSASVDVYETDGQFVCSFGKQIFSLPSDIIVIDWRVMVADLHSVHIFSEHGEPLNKFYPQRGFGSPYIAFHRESQQIFTVSSHWRALVNVEMYTKYAEFVRGAAFHTEKLSVHGIAVTTEGRIAVAGMICKGHSHQIIII